MERKESTDGPKWQAPAKIRGDKVAGVGSGRRWDERKGRDGPKRPAPARIKVRKGKMERKEGRDGPKWPASAKISVFFCSTLLRCDLHKKKVPGRTPYSQHIMIRNWT